MTPEEQQLFDETVGRGLVTALFFVYEQRERWPTLDDIRYIHRLIFEEAHPAMAGEYRQDSYWPQYTDFGVPLWADVPGCMLRLEDLLRQAKVECDASSGFEQQEKLLEWAARVHHRFECIHPFQDGNGRTGRALTSWMLEHYGFPTFDVTEVTKERYLSALAAADAELTTDDLRYADYWPRQTAALQPLIDFIGDVLECDVAAGEESLISDSNDS